MIIVHKQLEGKTCSQIMAMAKEAIASNCIKTYIAIGESSGMSLEDIANNLYEDCEISYIDRDILIAASNIRMASAYGEYVYDDLLFEVYCMKYDDVAKEGEALSEKVGMEYDDLYEDGKISHRERDILKMYEHICKMEMGF